MTGCYICNPEHDFGSYKHGDDCMGCDQGCAECQISFENAYLTPTKEGSK